MALDPSIPLQAGQAGILNLADMARQAQERRYRDMQMAELERKNTSQQEKGAALTDLIATRGPNGFDTQGEAFQRYTKAAPEDAFEMIKTLDADKRAQVKEGVKDLAAAVAWAKTPQDWAVIQQHYGKYDPQLASIPFEQREQAIIKLGQMAEYLEATKPEIKSIEAGGSLAAVDPRTGRATPLILPNDGSQTAYAPSGGAQGGIPPAAADYLRQNPHLKGAFEAKYGPGSASRVLGGGASNGTGGFRPVGMPGETVTSARRSVAHNKSVGGVPNSYHLSGRARDSVPPQGMSMAEYHRRLKALNPHLDVINEGDHVHMEPR